MNGGFKRTNRRFGGASIIAFVFKYEEVSSGFRLSVCGTPKFADIDRCHRLGVAVEWSGRVIAGSDF